MHQDPWLRRFIAECDRLRALAPAELRAACGKKKRAPAIPARAVLVRELELERKQGSLDWRKGKLW